MSNNAQEPRTFAAIISRAASKELTKQTENGESIYVLHNAKITQEGPLFGKEVTCQRTLMNSNGEQKEGVEPGQEVVLYLRIVEDERGKKPFFDISLSAPTASDDEILEALQVSTSATVDASQHI